MFFFEVRVSDNIVFTTAISIIMRHRTRDFKAGSACWMVIQQEEADRGALMAASTEPRISVKLSTLKLFY